MADETITLRLADPRRDAAACLDIYRPHIEQTSVSFETEVPTVKTFAARMAEMMTRYPWLVAERNATIVGYAYASSHRQRAAYRFSVEVSAYIDPAHHRQGVAGRLYRALFAVLREQGFINAYAGITCPNPASERFHVAMGFEPVGTYRHVGFKHGRWRDVTWSGLTLIEPTADPPCPQPMTALDEACLIELLQKA